MPLDPKRIFDHDSDSQTICLHACGIMCSRVGQHFFTRRTYFLNMFRMSCSHTYVDSLAYVSIGRDAGAYDKCAILAQESTWFKAQTVFVYSPYSLRSWAVFRGSWMERAVFDLQGQTAEGLTNRTCMQLRVADR